MMISADGKDFLDQREGCKLKAYQDQAGIWSIGYGSLIMPNFKKVKKGDKITLEQAKNLRDYELEGIADKIDLLINVELDQCQWDALISFCYNIGTEAFRNSTLRRIINSNTWREQQIRNEFDKWNKVHVDGKVVASKGLALRRKKEADLFFSCV